MRGRTHRRPAACAGCGKPTLIAFTITRHSTLDGGAVESWQVCSIVCVLRWAYAWTSAQGKVVSSAIESTITNLVTTFGGGKGE